MDCPLQPFFKGGLRFKTKERLGPTHIQLTAWLTVGFGRVPNNASMKTGQPGNGLQQVANADLGAASQIDGFTIVIMLGCAQDAVGGILDIEELARRRAITPGFDLRSWLYKPPFIELFVFIIVHLNHSSTTSTCHLLSSVSPLPHPNRLPVIKLIVAQIARIAAVGVHDPDLLAAGIAVRPENDLLPIGRPGRIFVPLPFVASQLGQASAIHVDHIDLIIARFGRDKDNAIINWRPDGVVSNLFEIG